jgi:hypothetical protein
MTSAARLIRPKPLNPITVVEVQPRWRPRQCHTPALQNDIYRRHNRSHGCRPAYPQRERDLDGWVKLRRLRSRYKNCGPEARVLATPGTLWVWVPGRQHDTQIKHQEGLCPSLPTPVSAILASTDTWAGHDPQLLHHAHHVDVMMNLTYLIVLKRQPEGRWDHDPSA